MEGPGIHLFCYGADARSGRARRWSAFVAALLLAGGACHAGEVEDLVETVKKEAEVAVAGLGTDVEFKIFDLTRKYVAALKDLEKKISAQGDLDAVLQVREEIASVEKSGEVTAHEGEELAKLRGIFRENREKLKAELSSARSKAVDAHSKKIQEHETAWTKAGKIDEALALRKAWRQALLELSPEAAAEVPFDEAPVAAAGELPEIRLPDKVPPPARDKPFAQRDWLESMSLPVAKQRIRGPIHLGDRGKNKWPLVIVPPGSVWSGSDDGRIFLSAATLMARKSSFSKLEIQSDHACHYHFLGCEFDDCRFVRGGVWWGGRHAAKFHLEQCLVKKRFSVSRMRVDDYGFRADRCVFQNIDFGEIAYEKVQPADLLNERWFKFVNCRFEKCKLPVSLLLQTRDCVFEECTFVDDAGEMADVDGYRSLEVVLFTKNCKNRVARLPETLKLVEKPLSDLKGAVVPAADKVLDLEVR